MNICLYVKIQMAKELRGFVFLITIPYILQLYSFMIARVSLWCYHGPWSWMFQSWMTATTISFNDILTSRVEFLLIMKEGKTTGSFCLHCLLHVLSMIIKSGVICTSVHSCTIIMCTDVMAVCMCPCMLLVTCAITVVCIYMWILQHYR